MAVVVVVELSLYRFSEHTAVDAAVALASAATTCICTEPENVTNQVYQVEWNLDVDRCR